MNYPEENSPDWSPTPSDEVTEDRDLRNLLGEWRPPQIASSVDRRIVTAYRQQFLHRRWWRRLLTGSISLPVPLVATALLLLCTTFYLAMRKAASDSTTVAPGNPPVQIVKVPVPVVEEKIVTRVVYKKIGAPKVKQESPTSRPAPRSDLANFRPVGQIKIIVSGGGNNEK